MPRALAQALRAAAFPVLALAVIGYAVYSGLHANDTPRPDAGPAQTQPAQPPPAPAGPSRRCRRTC